MRYIPRVYILDKMTEVLANLGKIKKYFSVVEVSSFKVQTYVDDLEKYTLLSIGIFISFIIHCCLQSFLLKCVIFLCGRLCKWRYKWNS